MHLRNKLGAAALLAAAAMASMAGCGGRDDDDNKDAGPGCTGVCSTDAGPTDAGLTDAGTDAGPGMTVAAIRKVPFGNAVTLRDVVVHTVDYEKLSDQNQISWRSRFWVVDPLKPTEGISVEKFYDDTPDNYRPQPGDVIDIEGFFGSEANFEPFRGRRQRISNDFRNGKIMKIIVKSTGGTRIAPNEVTAENLAAS